MSPLLLAGTIVVGCATSHREQIDNAIVSTNTSVRKIEGSLEKSVSQLNQTSADLSARVDEGDRQTRELRGSVEENQARLDKLQKSLDQLTATLYRYLNLTPSSAMPQVGIGAVPESAPAPSEGSEKEMLAPLTPSEEPAPGAAPAAATLSPSADGPASAITAYQQAQKTFGNQDYARALEQFQDYMERYPNTEFYPYAQFWVGECYFKIGKYEDAIQNFEALRKKYPTSSKVPIALNNQAAAHLLLGQTTRAVELLKELVQNFPLSPAADQAKEKLKEIEGR